jgi:ABC-type transporter MlaC component
MGRQARALVMLLLCLALAATTTTVAAGQPSPPTVEDQNDRLLRHLRAKQADLAQRALELQRSTERTFVPTFDAGDSVLGAGSTGFASAVPEQRVGVLVALLLGLTGGLVGGCAALAGWLVATGRRGRRATSTA